MPRGIGVATHGKSLSHVVSKPGVRLVGSGKGKGKTVDDARGNGRTRAKPRVKYKDDKGNAWTGRGATPKWLAAYEAEGRNRGDFAV